MIPLNDDDLIPQYRNLYAEMVIQIFFDLGGVPDERRRPQRGPSKSWVKPFQRFLKGLNNEFRESGIKICETDARSAIYDWAVGDLERFTLKTKADDETREAQRFYNLMLKRYLDRIYSKSDPILTAVIIDANPGLVTDYAKNSGCKDNIAAGIEKELIIKAGPFLMWLRSDLLSEPPADSAVNWSGFNKSLKMTRAEVS